MNAKSSVEVGVIPTLCAQTQKDPTFVVASVVLQEMVEAAQVKLQKKHSFKFWNSMSFFFNIWGHTYYENESHLSFQVYWRSAR